MLKTFLAAAAALSLAATASAEVRGHYLETRNAEIYASHCFANSELGIRGDLAVLAWSVDAGELDGVALDGAKVVAVVKASSTIGNPFSNPLPTKSMLIFSEGATPAQRAALEKLARRAAGELIGEVVETKSAPIALTFDGSIHQTKATLTAGDMIKVTTREIKKADSLCHLDHVYYQPMAELDHAMAAHAIEQSVDALGVKLNEYRRSSVYIGTFALSGAEVSD